jgi:hypothetical protein
MTRGMIPADLFRLQWVSDARIAPDGRTLAFTITCLDEGENHELSRSGKPSHRVQRFGYILNWFAEKLMTPAREDSRRSCQRRGVRGHRAAPAKSEAECTTSETYRWVVLDAP